MQTASGKSVLDGLVRTAIGALLFSALLVPIGHFAQAKDRAAGVIDQGAMTLTFGGQVADLDPANNEIEYADTIERNIDDTIKSLGSAARERLEAAALHDKQFDALRAAQANSVAVANPAMMDAQAQINAILQSANFSPDDAVQAARLVEQLGNVIASSNLILWGDPSSITSLETSRPPLAENAMDVMEPSPLVEPR